MILLSPIQLNFCLGQNHYKVSRATSCTSFGTTTCCKFGGKSNQKSNRGSIW